MEPEGVAGQAGGSPSPGRALPRPLTCFTGCPESHGGWKESSVNDTGGQTVLVLKCWDFTSSGLSRCGSDAFDMNSSQVHHLHSVASGISRFGVSDSVVRPYVSRAWAFRSF